MKAISLFSGVGGFDLGVERAGIEIVQQCEIDPYRRDVLGRHWPEVECVDDVESFHPAEKVDFIFGGFPCQDLSVAGRRKGLGGERSGLFFEFARIADEGVRDGGWILVENVPGLLSSPGKDRKGADFAVVLATLVDIGFHDLAWRILDSRYFGVPQRRRRLFILARRAGGNRAAQVLLEPQSGGGHIEEGWKKGQANPRAALVSAGEAGDQGPEVGAGEGEGKAVNPQGWKHDDPDVAFALDKQCGVTSQAHSANLIANALDRRGGGADDNEAQGNHIVAVGVNERDISGTLGVRGQGGGNTDDLDRSGAFVVSDTLRSHPRPGSNSDGNLVLQFNWQTAGSKDFLGVKEGRTDALHKSQVPAIAILPRERGEAHALDARNGNVDDDTVKTLTGGEHQSYSLNNMSIVARCLTANERWDLDTEDFVTVGEASSIHENQRAEITETDYAKALAGAGGKAGQGYQAAHVGVGEASEVRRLTPTECERLQGFPDGWTLLQDHSLRFMPSWYQIPFTFYSSPHEPPPDGRRYAAMGDAVTVPVAEWIARRVKVAHEQAG